jgi:hypothetical protein
MTGSGFYMVYTMFIPAIYGEIGDGLWLYGIGLPTVK